MTNSTKIITLTLTLAVSALCASAQTVDLTTSSQGYVTGDGGTGDGLRAIFMNHWDQPTGTGVFDPFLTLDANGQTSTGNKNIEQAYNTDGTRATYLDQLRPNQWNKTLTFGSLSQVNVNGVAYVVFDLDANEPGSNKSLISIDNIRVYTSATDKTMSNIGQANLNDLGALRWAMNDPLTTGTTPPDVNGFNAAQWVKLDANQNNNDSSKANGGSGQSDMWVLIPVAAFGNTLATDFVWFYNLNGVEYSADSNLGSTSGYEEWRALSGAAPSSVPDGGNTLALLGSALAVVGFIAHRSKLTECKA